MTSSARGMGSFSSDFVGWLFNGKLVSDNPLYTHKLCGRAKSDDGGLGTALADATGRIVSGTMLLVEAATAGAVGSVVGIDASGGSTAADMVVTSLSDGFVVS